MKEKIVLKGKYISEANFYDEPEIDMYDDSIDIYEGEDVERIKLMLYKSFLKRKVPSNKATILVETIMDLVVRMVEFRFNSKAMVVLNKAIDFINKRLV